MKTLIKQSRTSNESKKKKIDTVLRNLNPFSVGKDVFGSTYILTFGDNFTKEVKIINDVTVRIHTSQYVDPNTLENSLLVYSLEVTQLINCCLLMKIL